MPLVPQETQLIARIGWLRAAVLGANDGILSTASLIVSVASASGDKGAVMVAGLPGAGLGGNLCLRGGTAASASGVAARGKVVGRRIIRHDAGSDGAWAIGARIGGAPMWRGAARVPLWEGAGHGCYSTGGVGVWDGCLKAAARRAEASRKEPSDNPYQDGT